MESVEFMWEVDRFTFHVNIKRTHMDLFSCKRSKPHKNNLLRRTYAHKLHNNQMNKRTNKLMVQD